MYFYAWKKGLKTGMYYLRTQAAAQAVQFTVEKQGSREMEPVVAGAIPNSANDEWDGVTCSVQDG